MTEKKPRINIGDRDAVGAELNRLSDLESVCLAELAQGQVWLGEARDDARRGELADKMKACNARLAEVRDEIRQIVSSVKKTDSDFNFERHVERPAENFEEPVDLWRTS